jgi:CheY-like chemotaxis protein
MQTLLEEPRIILCVDDDADDQLMVHDIIRQLDATARIAAALNGIEALQYLQTAKDNELPCLIMLDINMPMMDGKQTLVRLKKEARYAHIPVVMFTTSSSALDKSFCQQHNTPFVTKPLKYNELQQTIATILSYCRVPIE